MGFSLPDITHIRLRKKSRAEPASKPTFATTKPDTLEDQRFPHFTAVQEKCLFTSLQLLFGLPTRPRPPLPSLPGTSTVRLFGLSAHDAMRSQHVMVDTIC